MQKFRIASSHIFFKSEIMNNTSLPLNWLVSLVFPVHENFLLACSICKERQKEKQVVSVLCHIILNPSSG